MARRHLKSAEKLLKAGESKALYEDISRALSGFIGDRTNVATTGMTIGQLGQLLAERNVGDQIREELQSLLVECDKVRFAPVPPDRQAMETATDRAAALIAGFVGATTQPIILSVTPFPTNVFEHKSVAIFLLATFLISALYGFIMKWSTLFPYLEKYYYQPLGVVGGMYHDGVSGLIVQSTLLLLYSTILR